MNRTIAPNRHTRLPIPTLNPTRLTRLTRLRVLASLHIAASYLQRISLISYCLLFDIAYHVVVTHRSVVAWSRVVFAPRLAGWAFAILVFGVGGSEGEEG